MKPIPLKLIWLVSGAAVIFPFIAATLSQQLQWRSPVYIGAGFAGIVAMACMLFQPLLITGVLTRTPIKARRLHRWFGIVMFVGIVLHVVGLWITSPPDVIDALLFVSPTPFSLWGVIAMWSVFVTFILVLLMKQARIKNRIWRLSHRTLAVVTVVATVLHAVQIDGTMEPWSKYVLCVLILLCSAWALFATKRNCSS